ncbi:hypothetical protein [Bythopirellula goksoeyrii]|uniref:BON domain protein n=1 Tax=Bythopirellula goksoeyrii TaxID=1400387 RepID=A0A5B9Q9Y1_9BACT|nr:hypothetical protein [Bythopirellula goksoeyrii]QEG35787.1 hypothetical protein Pr1d_30930 [Bythopirellula goksoeyrii]
MNQSECATDLRDHADVTLSVTGEVQKTIKERICHCPYAFHFNKVYCYYFQGTLTLRGSVATFHLKQILQTMLLDIKYVQRLVNEVDVTNAIGLSTERQK